MTKRSTTQAAERSTRPLRKGLLSVLGCAVIVAVAGLGYSIYQAFNSVPDAYAQWWVADMVIEHMEQNQGAWPNGWEELREPHRVLVERSGQPPLSFDKLRARVAIDFDADTATLVRVSQGKEPPFRVVNLRSGRETHWKGKEPNQMILDYLKQRAGR